MKKIINLVIIAVIMAVSIVALSGCKGKDKSKNSEDYLKPLNQYFEGFKEKNAEKISSVYPPFKNEKMSEAEINEIYAEYEKDVGLNISIDYSINNTLKLDKDQISEVAQEIGAIYSSFEKDKLTDAYCLNVIFKVAGEKVENQDDEEESDDEEDEEQAEKTVNTKEEKQDGFSIKYDGNWYIL